MSVRPDTFGGDRKDTRLIEIQYESFDSSAKVFQAAAAEADKSIQMQNFIPKSINPGRIPGKYGSILNLETDIFDTHSYVHTENNISLPKAIEPVFL